MAVVAVFVFFLLRLAPGDPAAIIAGDDATAETIAAVRAKLGLDRPIWSSSSSSGSGGLLHGDLGVSIFSNLPVTRLIAPAPRADAVARRCRRCSSRCASRSRSACWPPGRRGTLVDRLVMGFAVLGFSVPVFVVGYVLIYVFAVQLRLAAGAGLHADRRGLWPLAAAA